ncbi:hypothetical protein [Clostridium sp. AWRP]|nr:hypothetical protein [Clostridium sp. AWRP]
MINIEFLSRKFTYAEHVMTNFNTIKTFDKSKVQYFENLRTLAKLVP